MEIIALIILFVLVVVGSGSVNSNLTGEPSYIPKKLPKLPRK